MNTVERLARVIYARHYSLPLNEIGGDTGPWRSWEPEARAVLKELRTPDEAMVFAAQCKVGMVGTTPSDLLNSLIVPIWQAAIDKALEE